jgi:hypothetical protein
MARRSMGNSRFEIPSLDHQASELLIGLLRCIKVAQNSVGKSEDVAECHAAYVVHLGDSLARLYGTILRQ